MKLSKVIFIKFCCVFERMSGFHEIGLMKCGNVATSSGAAAVAAAAAAAPAGAAAVMSVENGSFVCWEMSVREHVIVAVVAISNAPAAASSCDHVCGRVRYRDHVKTIVEAFYNNPKGPRRAAEWWASSWRARPSTRRRRAASRRSAMPSWRRPFTSPRTATTAATCSGASYNKASFAKVSHCSTYTHQTNHPPNTHN